MNDRVQQNRISRLEQLALLLSKQDPPRCLLCQASRGRGLMRWRCMRSSPEAPSLQHWLCSNCERAVPWIRSIHCTRCGRGTVCPDCLRHPKRSFSWNRSAVRYDPLMREWLAQYKFRGRERLMPLLGEMMLPLASAVIDKLSHDRHSNRPIVLTYIPLSRERMHGRGFNQAEQLAAYLSRALQLPMYTLLHRHRHTEKQSYKDRKSRLRALRGAFSYNETAKLHVIQEGVFKPYVLIVDDVYTTGSTLEEAAKVIRNKLDCDVAGLTWARA